MSSMVHIGEQIYHFTLSFGAKIQHFLRKSADVNTRRSTPLFSSYCESGFHLDNKT